MIMEAAIVAVVGLGAALAANEFSPRGLVLSRNYFPEGTNSVPAAPKLAQAAPVPAATEDLSEAAQLSARLRDKGLQEVKRAQAEILFHDPRHQEGRIVFVDARDEDHYQESHIPGAYELDPYHPEKELGTVLPVCQAAEEVVVYCTGGDCEDSDTTAILLRDAGVPVRKLFVYGGGFTEWADAHLPLEVGARNSGVNSK
jgi:rhodanese-related sulfurtransferase